MYSFCRKVVPVVAISACLLSSTAISASAAMLPAEQASVSLSSAGAEARMTLISECDCFISADGSMVYADASVSGYSGEATKCKITLSIQEKVSMHCIELPFSLMLFQVIKKIKIRKSLI